MKKRGDGLIINISSVAGKRALPVAGVAYSASKFGMTSLGTSAGLALADSGVRVTNVYPGEVNTPILDQRPSPVPQEKKDRMVHPEDIGALVTTIAKLPSRSHIPEVIIKPLYQDYLDPEHFCTHLSEVSILTGLRRSYHGESSRNHRNGDGESGR
jgi:NAD(P)-dependent dehydrogenase (short-subunit alcohol dehydrogenase family)